MKYPYIPLYTGDWRKSTDIQFSSLAARGLWLELLIAMHENDRSGEISGTPEQFARLVGCSADEFMLLINELNCNKVANVIFCNKENNTIVTVINRRMKREYKDRILTRERVKKHRKNKKKNGKCNTDVTGIEPDSTIESEIENEIDNKKSLKYLEDNIESFIESFKNIDVEFELDKFKDWMKSKGKRYKDYSAAFRNWLRNESIPKKQRKIKSKKDLFSYPKYNAGWEPMDEYSKDNLEHKIQKFQRYNIDHLEYIWYCEICDKQFEVKK